MNQVNQPVSLSGRIQPPHPETQRKSSLRPNVQSVMCPWSKNVRREKAPKSSGINFQNQSFELCGFTHPASDSPRMQLHRVVRFSKQEGMKTRKGARKGASRKQATTTGARKGARKQTKPHHDVMHSRAIRGRPRSTT